LPQIAWGIFPRGIPGNAPQREASCGQSGPQSTIMGDTQEAREEGFYWVMLGQNPPEIA